MFVLTFAATTLTKERKKGVKSVADFFPPQEMGTPPSDQHIIFN